LQNNLRPSVINQYVNNYLADLKSQLSIEDRLYIENPDILSGLENLFGVSQYAAEISLKWPEMILCQLKEKRMEQSLTPNWLYEALDDVISNINDEAELMKRLRLFRHMQMWNILWRDANALASIEETMRDLSFLADRCIDSALTWLYEKMIVQYGIPFANGIQQKMVILGMGKLGGKELNFSSDVDLIFCFPSSGKTEGGKREIENNVFFSRLGQSLIRVLDQITEEGFVYRLDLRLRPYGGSGALAWSFSAMEQYYQDQGRDWERYAMIKARPVAGDKEQGFLLLKALKPFIYRRYLDFSLIDALRDMKGMIHREVLRKNMVDNIKLGRGGIREIEFIVQSFQLIYGGRKRQLQSVSLLDTLKKIVPLKFLSKDEAEILRQAYLFLRRLEHLLQAWQDKQTQKLSSDALHQTVLAWAMGYDDWEQLANTLEKLREQVESLFTALMADKEEVLELKGTWQLLWAKKIDKAESIEFLTKYHFKYADDVYQQIMLLRNSSVLNSASRTAKMRVNQFIPVLLDVCGSQSSPDQAILRTLPIVHKVLKRSSYLVLLLERPDALCQLVKLCHDGAWVAGEITRHPALIDEFLNAGDLYNPPPPEHLSTELSLQLVHIPLEDIESRLESLCYFKLSHLLKSVVAQTNGYMPLMAVSNYLTWVAESIVKEIVHLSWSIMVRKYGHPDGCDEVCLLPFIALGYGKLGGLEMGPSSDLDLVFVHNTNSQGSTDGIKPIENQTFFARFAQKVIHLLTTETSLGKLYSVDVRLRPSGNAGLLVSSINAYAKYQREEAWTWECQALIKARVIYGESTELAEEFRQLRASVLQKERDVHQLISDIKVMRKKMFVLNKASKQQFDLKYGRGGMVDIEFLVQYLVLRWAPDYASLLRWTDNIRLLDTLRDEELMSASNVKLLQDAYLILRDASHQRARQNQGSIVDVKQFIKERQAVIQCWNAWLSDDVEL